MTSIFDKIYFDYILEIKKCNLEFLSKKIGVHWNGKEMILPLFSKNFYVSQNYILNPYRKRPNHYEIVVIAKYIISFAEKEIKVDGDWIHYRNFKDSAPLQNAFYNNVEKKIADYFQGNNNLLIKRCRDLNGITYKGEWNYDVSFLFYALPKIPLLLLYNDADDLFPAQCNVLFKSTLKYHLDMESVAIIGMILVNYLLSPQEF